MDRAPKTATTAVVVLAVLGIIAALYLMKAILVPIALALLLACLLSTVTALLRRLFRLSATGAAVLLFVLMAILGLYLASLTAESLVEAANTLPSDIENLAGLLSRRITDMYRDRPYLRGILPDPRTIDLLGSTNAWLIGGLRYYVSDLTFWVAQGFIILILVLFLLAESEMLAPRVIRFFAPTPRDLQAAEQTLKSMIRQIRAFLLARSLINLGVGVVLALVLWLLGVKYPVALGLFAALTNFVPYVGQIVGGSLTVLVALGQWGSIGDALIIAAIFVGVVGLEGYIITPWVMGRSLDLNGTTVLIACLFWGFLWGLVGLFLAVPITASLKLVFQHSPHLHRWADLMSQGWQTPAHTAAEASQKPESLPVPPANPAPLPASDDPETRTLQPARATRV